MKIHSFPKIFAIGSDYIPDLFKGTVEVTEKIDGSQFSFGVYEGEIVMRSKGKELFFEDYAKMFKIAVDWIDKNKEKITALGKNITFYGEFLGSPSHNVLKYDRVPKNNIILFGVMEGESFVKNYKKIKEYADKLGLETVQLLYEGEVKTFDELKKFLKLDSMLGSELVEGIVVKNYSAPCIIGSRIFPSFGKYVREAFKERHSKDWGAKFSGKNKLQEFIDSFRTEARWQKAIQHLREVGKLVNEPKDIGILLKEIERDLVDEERKNIKKELFNLFRDTIARKAKSGFPEYYKEQLAKKAFKEKKD